MTADHINRAAEVLEVHQMEFIDHEVGYECGCNEHGTGHPEGLRFQSDALRHQAEALDAAGLLVTPERDRQVAAKALREAADEMRYIFLHKGTTLGMPADDWLLDRADRIEREAGESDADA